MKYAIILNKNTSKKIFSETSRGKIFFISHHKQNIEVDDDLYLCAYYPMEDDKVLSVVKCKLVSYELSENKEDCLFSTPKSCYRYELEYSCDNRKTLITDMNWCTRFKTLSDDLPSYKKTTLQKIFELNFDKEI